MRFNLETVKEKLTEYEDQWCGTDDDWFDVETLDDTIISANVYMIKVFVDEDAHPDDYGVTIYETGLKDDGYRDAETDRNIVGQLYFRHIKNHTEGKLFQITDVIDYEHHVFNNADPRNPKETK